jgi:AAA domain
VRKKAAERAVDRPGSQHNLPVPLTSFVGREREVAEIRVLLAQGDTALPTSHFPLPTSNRLVTLTGAGGCGKTRLALTVAHTLTDAYPDGVWFVDLSALNDLRIVPVAVAQVLKVREEVGRLLLATLLAALQPRRLLLVLDNCERLLAACAEFIRVVAEECPGVAFLATSRAPLGLPGEVSWRVPSLALPDPRHLPRDGAALVPIARDRGSATLRRARRCPPGGLCHHRRDRPRDPRDLPTARWHPPGDRTRRRLGAAIAGGGDRRPPQRRPAAAHRG